MSKKNRGASGQQQPPEAPVSEGVVTSAPEESAPDAVPDTVAPNDDDLGDIQAQSPLPLDEEPPLPDPTELERSSSGLPGTVDTNLEPEAPEELPDEHTPEEPPQLNRAQVGKVRCRALTTVVVDAMPQLPGTIVFLPWHNAHRLADKGNVELLDDDE